MSHDTDIISADISIFDDLVIFVLSKDFLNWKWRNFVMRYSLCCNTIMGPSWVLSNQSMGSYRSITPHTRSLVWGVGVVKRPLYWCWFCLLWLLSQTTSIFVFEWCCSILWLRFFCIRPHFWRYSAILRLVHKLSRVSAGMHCWFLRLEKVLLSRFCNCRWK